MRRLRLQRLVHVAVLLGAVAALPAGAAEDASRRIYFAAGGKPFMAVYTGRGFAPASAQGDITVLKNWEPLLRARRTFPA